MTDTISFDPERAEPPVILDSPTSAIEIGDVFWVDKTARTEWSMSVVVRESDPRRELSAHFRIVNPAAGMSSMAPQFEWVPVPGGGLDPELRDLTFTVQTDSLALAECHRLELVVSGSFFKDAKTGADRTEPVFFDLPDPDSPGDIASAVWWVWEGNPDRVDYLRLVQSCDPKKPLLAPPEASSELTP